jgi:hypothetical protein
LISLAESAVWTLKPWFVRHGPWRWPLVADRWSPIAGRRSLVAGPLVAGPLVAGPLADWSPIAGRRAAGRWSPIAGRRAAGRWSPIAGRRSLAGQHAPCTLHDAHMVHGADGRRRGAGFTDTTGRQKKSPPGSSPAGVSIFVLEDA